MLKKLRRSSKQVVSMAKRLSDLPATTTPTSVSPTRQSSVSTTQNPTISRLGFFDLPAEVRNLIYEEVAAATTLSIPSPARKPKKEPLPIPNLLLVSKQTRHEYLPLLLELALIYAPVRAFNFHHLTRLISSLYATELRALRANLHLTIRIECDANFGHVGHRKSTDESIASLRRWLVKRTAHLDRLPWSYAVAWPKTMQLLPTSAQVAKVNTFIQRRTALGLHRDAMDGLACELDEALRWELQPILEAFEAELAAVGTDPGLPWREEVGITWILGARGRWHAPD